MKPVVASVVAVFASMSFVAGVHPASTSSGQLLAGQRLHEQIVGNWGGVLVINDPRRNFSYVRAHLRFTEGTIFVDRDEFFGFGAVRG